MLLKRNPSKKIRIFFFLSSSVLFVTSKFHPHPSHESSIPFEPRSVQLSLSLSLSTHLSPCFHVSVFRLFFLFWVINPYSILKKSIFSGFCSLWVFNLWRYCKKENKQKGLFIFRLIKLLFLLLIFISVQLSVWLNVSLLV